MQCTHSTFPSKAATGVVRRATFCTEYFLAVCFTTFFVWFGFFKDFFLAFIQKFNLNLCFEILKTETIPLIHQTKK